MCCHCTSAAYLDFEAETLLGRICARVMAFGVEIMDALSETNEDLKKDQDDSSKALNIRDLRKNSKRCGK